MLKKYFALVFTIVFSGSVYAGCSVSGTTIDHIYRYDDGTLFINVNDENDCGCGNKKRFGITSAKVDSDGFTSSAALTALMSGVKVDIAGWDGCSIHSNTAELRFLTIRSK